MATNRNRAERAGQVLREYTNLTVEDVDPIVDEEVRLSDLLVDLNHYADLNGLDFTAAQARARRHYGVESNYHPDEES